MGASDGRCRPGAPRRSLWDRNAHHAAFQVFRSSRGCFPTNICVWISLNILDFLSSVVLTTDISPSSPTRLSCHCQSITCPSGLRRLALHLPGRPNRVREPCQHLPRQMGPPASWLMGKYSVFLRNQGEHVPPLG